MDLGQKTRKLINRLTNKLVLFALTILFLLLLITSTLFAAGAKLFLSPETGPRDVGSYLSVDVLVNTGGNPTNAYRAVVTYPAAKLEAIAVSTGGSVCSLWIPPTPRYSNDSGTATFECGATKAYKGTSGRIGRIDFLVKAAGKAAVSISAGEVKKADGIGTELLSSRGAASFDLQETPVGVPVISSSTHPNQNAWYREKSVELAWTATEEADGFSYSLNQKAGDTPDDISEGPAAGKTYPSVADGIWYFHLKARQTRGWGFAGHFRIQIDNAPPEPFTIVVDPPTEKITRAPLLSFATTDKLSGIDHYEIAIDGAAPLTPPTPYPFDRIKGGIHPITVQAIDRAGNSREAKATLDVIGVSSPTITSPTEGEKIPFLSPLTTRGTSSQPGTVELALDGRLIAEVNSGTGDFEHSYRKIILPGNRKLEATLITAEGIESEPATVTFQVDLSRVYLLRLVRRGYPVYAVALLIFAGLATLFILKIKRWRRLRKPKQI